MLYFWRNLRTMRLHAGDPARTDAQPRDMTWTIRCDEYYTVTVGRLGSDDGSSTSFGYVVRESDKCAVLRTCGALTSRPLIARHVAALVELLSAWKLLGLWPMAGPWRYGLDP